MTYQVRFTRAASDDLDRLYGFIVDRDDADINSLPVHLQP